MKNLLFLATLGFSLSTTVADAALILSEPFRIGSTAAAGEYTASQITGQNPVISGYTGAWLNGNATAVVSSLGLSYPGLLTSGGALVANNGSSREGRLLASPFTAASSGTFYLSFLLDLSVSSGGNYKAFELHNGGFADASNRVMQIGQGGTATDFNGSTNFGLRLFSNDSFRIDLGTADANTNLFVVRFDLSTTNNGDSIAIYRNPGLDQEPAVPIGTLSGFNLNFDRTSIANYQSNGDSITVDEIRLGDSYASVLPAPEPATGILLLAGAAAALRRRRQRA